MIRNYFHFPQRRGADREQEMRQRRQDPSWQPSSPTQRNDDWDRSPDPESLRWSPRSAQRSREPERDTSQFDEGYGYGDPYFSDDQRVGHPRFQEGWEGSYRSTPWTLGSEQISPGSRGPYGRSPQYDMEEAWYSGDNAREGSYRRGPQRQGLHRGVGPQSYTRADERIREDVCDQLTDHPEVDARHIEVTVNNGVVLLQGKVTDRRMKYGAEECSWDVTGVKDVDNRIRVDRGQAAPAREGTDFPR